MRKDDPIDRCSRIEAHKPKVDAAAYRLAIRSHRGWCIVCRTFTRTVADGHVEAVTCPDCKEPAVYGLDSAVAMEAFVVVEIGPDAEADDA